jgi:DNA repair protein RecO (recombination protein O)
MPAHVSESLVLRTYPFGEGDLIVSFLTRESGKQRGAAKRARKARSPYGAALERLSHARITYTKRETRELVSLTGAELISSPFALGGSSYETSLALDFIAEMAELLLPPEEVNEKYFRLILSVMEHLREKGIVWTALTYYSLWAVRLSGFLPSLRLSAESAEIAEEMLLCPVAKLSQRVWSKETASDLRRLLVREVEQHVERRLLTYPMLESL